MGINERDILRSQLIKQQETGGQSSKKLTILIFRFTLIKYKNHSHICNFGKKTTPKLLNLEGWGKHTRSHLFSIKILANDFKSKLKNRIKYNYKK